MPGKHLFTDTIQRGLDIFFRLNDLFLNQGGTSSIFATYGVTYPHPKALEVFPLGLPNATISKSRPYPICEHLIMRIFLPSFV
jgi:hypothetical protein